MRQMHDKLVSDKAELESRKDALKAKIRLAKAQEDVNRLSSKTGSSSSSFATFERIEDKIDARLDMANAETELNSSLGVSEADNLAAKYDASPDTEVQDELAALKAQLGVTSQE
jgi:phage shock protein A